MDNQPVRFTDKSVTDTWAAAGLNVLEVAEAELAQTIMVQHNPLTGKFSVTYNRLDAAQALGLLADAMLAVWKDAFKGDLRPALNSGHSKLCVELDGQRLLVAFGTHTAENGAVADPVVAKGMAAAALFGLCAIGDTFNPLNALLAQIELPAQIRAVLETNGNLSDNQNQAGDE